MGGRVLLCSCCIRGGVNEENFEISAESVMDDPDAGDTVHCCHRGTGIF